MTIAITIKTDRDLTPKGKRTARVVQLNQGLHIRWYVSGRIYATKNNTPEMRELTREWLAAA